MHIKGIEIIKQPEELHAQRQAYIYTSIIVCLTLQLSYNSVVFSQHIPINNKTCFYLYSSTMHMKIWSFQYISKEFQYHKWIYT